jgi:hypothetical protein
MLQKGFVITAIDGQNAVDLRTVAGVLAHRDPGSKITLSVVVPRRIGTYMEFRQGNVTLTLR